MLKYVLEVTKQKFVTTHPPPPIRMASLLFDSRKSHFLYKSRRNY